MEISSRNSRIVSCSSIGRERERERESIQMGLFKVGVHGLQPGSLFKFYQNLTGLRYMVYCASQKYHP